MSEELDWLEMEMGKPIATFTNTNSLTLTFLSNGKARKTTITDKKTNEKKEVIEVHFEVTDFPSQKDKDFNILAGGLRDELKPFHPLTGKTLIIDKFGTGMQTNYKVREKEI